MGRTTVECASRIPSGVKAAANRKLDAWCFIHTIWDEVIIVSLTRAATISIHVPAVLRACCEGAPELSLSAPSVRAALEQLEQRYPSLYRSICDETGTVRRHVNLFVNTDHVRDREGLDTRLEPGDVVTILPAISGGLTCRSE